MKHKYTSYNTRYYWFNSFFVMLQDATGIMPKYACVRTTLSAIDKGNFDDMKERGVLIEIELEEFMEALGEAIHTINELSLNLR